MKSQKCGIRLIISGIGNDEDEICPRKAEYSSKDRPYFEIIKIPKCYSRWIGSKQSHIIELNLDLNLKPLENKITLSKVYRQTVIEKILNSLKIFGQAVKKN